MGTHLRVLSESVPMNTNMTGSRWFQKYLSPCGFDEGSLSNGRVKGVGEWLVNGWWNDSVGGIQVAMETDTMETPCQHMTSWDGAVQYGDGP